MTDVREPVGSITEEAFKLFRAMNSVGHTSVGDLRATSRRRMCARTSWCPVCQVVGFVHDNPEALAQVSQSAATLARSLRDLFDAALTSRGKPVTLAIGVDIGGTKIAAGLVSESGEILEALA